MLSLLTFLARFFEESEVSKSKEHEDRSREHGMTAGLKKAFLALLRKAFDSESEEVARVISLLHSIADTFGKVL